MHDVGLLSPSLLGQLHTMSTSLEAINRLRIHVEWTMVVKNCSTPQLSPQTQLRLARAADPRGDTQRDIVALGWNQSREGW